MYTVYIKKYLIILSVQMKDHNDHLHNVYKKRYLIMFSVQMKDLLLFFSLGLRGKELQEVSVPALKDLDKGEYMN